MSDEDKVVHLFAGLSESYDVLVTALESVSDAVPALEVVTERLLREEQKLWDREEGDDCLGTQPTQEGRAMMCAGCKAALATTYPKPASEWLK